MLKKKEKIAVRFVENRVQVVLAGKKGVRKYLEVEVGEDVIKDEKVCGIEGLAKILAGLFQKIGTKERGVRLCLSEKGAYVKVVSMPKMEISEIDSALRWHLDSHLPYAADEVYLDWKLIKEKEEGVEVLLLAVVKDWADPYLEAVRMAGLEVLSLESSSVAIQRMFRLPEKNVLALIEVGKKRTTVLICQNGFVWSSSHFSIEEGSVSDQTLKVLNYYQLKKGIEKLGGFLILGEEGNLGSKLSESLGIKQGEIRERWGLSREGYGKYGVAVGVAMSELLAPESEKSINLIPKNTEDRLVQKSKEVSINRSLKIFCGGLLVFSVMIWLAAGYLYQKEQSLVQKKKSLTTEILKVDKKSLEEINALPILLDSVEGLAGDRSKYFELMKKVMDVAPKSLSVSRIDLDYVERKGKVVGFTSSREAMVEYRVGLRDGGFLSLEIPLSSLEKSSNFDFVINFLFE